MERGAKGGDNLHYYKELQSDGFLAALLTYDTAPLSTTNPLIVEISEEEYSALLDEIISSVQPEELEETDEISAEEALYIILGVST